LGIQISVKCRHFVEGLKIKVSVDSIDNVAVVSGFEFRIQETVF